MAVNVTSWQEFLTAASGNDPTLEINLPENAVWDLAEIEPEGHAGYITLCGQINGNGTTIKNLVIQQGITSGKPAFYVNGTVVGLHIINAHLTPADALVAFLSAESSMQLCTISAICSGNSGKVFSGNGGTVYRCAVNLEYANNVRIFLTADNTIADYLNAKISGSTVSEVYIHNSYQSGYVKNSYIILDTPATTAVVGQRTWWSVIRCNAANVTSLSSFNSTYFCLGVDSDFPNVQTVSDGIKLVSENQLRDPAYLQSIGFPIGVNE